MIQPLYFGTAEKPLFGVYHAADVRTAKPMGAVVCPPFGHEYIQSYRALRNLAVQLARGGSHVLRFDYFGTGDSAGDGADASVEQWLEDIRVAIEELKDTTGLGRVSLIGLRVGAALAYLASGGRTDIDTLVLWDPVLRGKDFLERGSMVQSAWLKTRPQLRLSAADGASELIGFPVSAGLRRGFEEVDLSRTAAPSVRCCSLVMSEDDPEVSHWAARLESVGMALRCRHVPSANGVWNRVEAVHAAFLPEPELFQAVISEVFGDVP